MALPQASNTELDKFFSFLYHDTEGYAYIATKNPKLPNTHPEFWRKHFFQWPREKDRMISFVTKASREYDVYSSPSLFRTADATKSAWLGTWNLWTEFDGNAPEVGSAKKNYPHPSMRIRSSDETHEHWYWQLHRFCDSAEIFEQHSRRTSYGLEGDTSTWNCNRVLRPPGTLHHESGRTTAIIAELASSYELSDISNVFSEPPIHAIVTEPPKNIPNVNAVVAKYQWPDHVFKKFVDRAEVGKRSDTLCWIAHECAVMGMNDAEVMSILINCDERWKKFAGRPDRFDQLSQIIANTRQKHPQNTLPVMGFKDFVKQEIKLRWIFGDLLPQQSLTTLVSPPGVGKTQFTLQAAIHLALGKEFLGFPVEAPEKSMFTSLEMSNIQLHHFLEQMTRGMSDEDLELLQKNLLIVPLGRSLSLNKKGPQGALTELVNEYEPGGLFVDSLSTSLSESANGDEAVGALFDFYKKELISRDLFVWNIHHFRKSQVGNRHPDGQDDLRGSGMINQLSDLILSMEDLGTSIKIQSLKTRMSLPISEFHVVRQPDLSFIKVDKRKEEINDNQPANPNKDTLRDSI